MENRARASWIIPILHEERSKGLWHRLVGLGELPESVISVDCVTLVAAFDRFPPDILAEIRRRQVEAVLRSNLPRQVAILKRGRDRPGRQPVRHSRLPTSLQGRLERRRDLPTRS